MPTEPEYVVDFPTLGYLVADWIEQHCIVPDGFSKGKPYVMADWQLWCTVSHYRVRVDAVWDPDEPRVSTAFFYRRSQVVAPQKTGKGPWAAAIIACEGVGPSVFVGFAEGGEAYECADHGCDCGWVYEYEPDEPMGIPRPTPLIQLTATSKDQTANVYRPLKAMFRGGGLEFAETKTGEEFIRLPDDGRIDTVTSSAQSKLGNPVTFVLHDESGIYTKTNGMVRVADTQLRGLAGMDARGIETTNPWDPAEKSTAQMTYESSSTDIFKFYRKPPVAWSYRNRDDRRKIHRFVYEGSWWVNLDAIEGLALELIERGEVAQAERFFGNRIVAGLNAYFDVDHEAAWEARLVDRPAPVSGPVCLAFDGSDSDDWTSIRAETMDGWQFTPRVGPDKLPSVWDPAKYEGRIPRGEVEAAVDELFTRYKVVRFYCDPPDWDSEIEDWALKYGEAVTEWPTYRVTQMHEVLKRFLTDLKTGRLTHDGCSIAATHLTNARKVAKPGQRYILGKPTQHQKIDHAMTSTLVHEAVCDSLAAGWTDEPADRRVIVFR